jgi:hypothetical protein
MPRRLFFAVLALGLACGSPPKPSNGPKTATEKQRLEAKTEPPDAKAPKGRKWSGWRYQGDRKECFFLVGRRCFKTRDGACEAAKCPAAKTCSVEDGGPSIVSCK